MKTSIVKLIGVDITVHNKREESLVNIVRNDANSCLQWMDFENDDEILSSCSTEKRERIAERIANGVDEMFTAMYYLGMIKQPVCIYLDDIMSWNGED